MSAIQLDLSRQKLYVSPDDPLPEFHPHPRAIQVTPIYDAPIPGTGASTFPGNAEPPDLDQSLSARSRQGPSSPLIINRSSEYVDPNPERYQASSSRRRDDHPYAYYDQRYDSYPSHYRGPSYYPEYPRDPRSQYHPEDNSRLQRSSDYYDSFDNRRARDDYDDYDSSDYDRSPDYDRSSDYDRASDYDYSSEYNRTPEHDRYSSDYDRPPSDYDRTRPEHYNPSSSKPYRSSTQHEPERKTEPERQGYTATTKKPSKPSKQFNYLEHNRKAANKDPHKHLKNFPDEIQRILKALPPSPHFRWSECTGRRKAVCVGVNYVGQKDALKGCANDARNMRSFLMNYYGFKSRDIYLLTDDGQAATMKPTRSNMFDAMKWLVQDAKAHDSLFFHYSGHGGQVEDKTGKEADGKNEVIFPTDFKATSHIVDDDLFKALVAPLPTGCRLTAVFDSCHSGTVLDLPYLHSAHGRLRSLTHITQRAQQRKEAPSADVICFAACKDDETSADTFEGGVSVGAMSYALLKILKKNVEQNTHETYAQILQQLRDILIPKYKQKAQISGTHPVDLERDFTL